MKKLETTFQLFGITEDKTLFQGITVNGLKNCLSLETISDEDDGTFEDVADYIKFLNKIDRNGTEEFFAYFSDITKPLEYDGCTIDLTGRKVIVTFDEPFKVLLTYIGENPVIIEVKKVEGELTHEYSWSNRTSRQDKVANRIEVFLSIEKYLE